MELLARSKRSHICARVPEPSTRIAALRRMRRRLYLAAGRDCIRLPKVFADGLTTPVSIAQREPVRQFWSTDFAPKPALATTGGTNHPGGTLPKSPCSKLGFAIFDWAKLVTASKNKRQTHFMLRLSDIASWKG